MEAPPRHGWLKSKAKSENPIPLDVAAALLAPLAPGQYVTVTINLEGPEPAGSPVVG